MAVDEGAKRREKKTHSRVDAMGDRTRTRNNIFESCILFFLPLLPHVPGHVLKRSVSPPCGRCAAERAFPRSFKCQ